MKDGIIASMNGNTLIDSEGEHDVKCIYCNVPGQEEDDGTVYYPTT